MLQSSSVQVVLGALECSETGHELLHHCVHILAGNVTIKVLVEMCETELVLLLKGAVLVDVEDRGELLERDVLIPILVSYFEDPVTEEGIASLADEPEELPELSHVHQTCIRHLLYMALRDNYCFLLLAVPILLWNLL